MWELLHKSYNSRLHARTNNIQDVYDGKEYKRNGFPKGVGDISFIVNTDGVAVFRSSKKALWPVWLVINELPPTER